MKKALNFDRYFVPALELAEKQFKWKRVSCRITDAKGEAVFEQDGVEAPQDWSQVAVDIAASKYFRKIGKRAGQKNKGPSHRESSIREIVNRVVDCIVSEAKKKQVFAKGRSLANFKEELKFILLSQRAFFNSPVWFNCGLQSKPQVSACFIQSVADDIDGIFELLKNEAKIFKFGSGSGTNFSSLRSKYEDLHSGGKSSGMMAFLDVFDRGAGSIKSGGTTRRAAKMVSVDFDHPEIIEFIQWKAHEEKKAQALIAAGYSGKFEGEAYRTVSGQNSNNSVRVSDQFMRALSASGSVHLKLRINGKNFRSVPAQEIWDEIVKAAWQCGDPGLQFHDTVNRWHTCPNAGPIRGSNPCSEYMFLDNSACNLASLNLLKFLDDDGHFDLSGYLHTVRTIFIAQEILVGLAGYPTEAIEKNSLDYRPVGLGFCGLGAFLMRRGLSYDSDLARAWAGSLSALLLGQAMVTSSELAARLGAFNGYAKNRLAFQKVVKRHSRVAKGLNLEGLGTDFTTTIGLLWKQALALGAKYGFRNSQFTVMAPTGTIGLAMDSETTGIEPEFSLTKTKTMTGQGVFNIVSSSLGPALKKLGYPVQIANSIQQTLENGGQLVECKELLPEHHSVFACAHGAGEKSGILSVSAHLRMMAAVQPFMSGAISKTVNLPNSAGEKDISEVYQDAWKMGLKSISIYRDGCKASQPLTSGRSTGKIETSLNNLDNPFCPECGNRMLLIGGCYQCTNCGYTTGCVC